MKKVVRIALAQVSSEEEKEKNIKKALTFMQKAREKNANIICFPELCSTFFIPQYRADKKLFDLAEEVPGPTVKRFQEQAKKLNLVTIINLFERAGPGEYYDTSPVIDSNGKLLGMYRMVHIAELPNYNEKFYYWPGNTGYQIFETRHAKIGVAICWDRHFPEVMRILALKGAEIIFAPTAGAVREYLPVWELEIQAHSVANQVFIGLPNRVGKEEKMTFYGRSFITSPKGEVIARAGEEEELLIANLDLGLIEEARQLWPFFRDRRPETYGDIIKIKG